MSDGSRQVVPNKGTLSRERLVTKALKLPSCTRKSFFFSCEREWKTREGVYTERHDDRLGGRIPSKKWKTKVAILKMILSLTGSITVKKVTVHRSSKKISTVSSKCI